jgi:hypothetical protein
VRDGYDLAFSFILNAAVTISSFAFIVLSEWFGQAG